MAKSTVLDRKELIGASTLSDTMEAGADDVRKLARQANKTASHSAGIDSTDDERSESLPHWTYFAQDQRG